MKITQASFTAGELSPSLWSRVDFAKFHVGAKVLKNFIVQAEGGATNRPGTEYIGTLADGNASARLIPFEFNTSQTYMLVFTNLKMRVIHSGAFVDGATPGLALEVTSPYAVADLPLLRFSQSADTLFLTHPSYSPRSLTRTAHDAWAFATLAFEAQADPPTSVVASPAGSTGAVTYTYIVYSESTGTLLGVPYTYQDDTISASLVVTVRDPWVGSVTLSWYDTNGNGGAIYRNGVFYRHTGVITNNVKTFVDSNQGASGAAYSIINTGNYCINFAAAYDIGASLSRDYKYAVSAVVANDESLPSVETVGASSRPWSAGETITISWNIVPEATLYNIYKNANGQWGWIGTVDHTATPARQVEVYTLTTGQPYKLTVTKHKLVTGNQVTVTNAGTATAYVVTVIDVNNYTLDGTSAGSTSTTNNPDMTAQKMPFFAREFIDDNINPDISYGVRGDLIYDFTLADKYPMANALYQQRLVFGGSSTDPTAIWTSRIGSLVDFSQSSPLRVDDPVEVTPASGKVNGIRHIVPLDGLIIFTAGSEIILRGADGALKANNAEFSFQSYIGCAEYPAPLPINKSVVFAQRDGKKIHDYTFKFEADGYTGSDLNALANHVFSDSKIVSWAYQQSPFGVIWAARADGTLRGMTYLREHDVFAWHRHETDGLFTAVGCITGSTQDDVYFIVNRTIGASSVFYVEKLATRVADGGIFLDSCLTYNSTPATAISGLSHLEGKTVNALADGDVVRDLVVTAGAITLPQAASTVHIGLPYVSELQTLDLDLEGNNQGKRQKIAGVVMRLLESRGGSVGPDSSNLYDIPYRAFEAYNEPTALRTGDIDMAVSPSWGRQCKLVIRQTSPLPITILAVIPDVEIGT